MKPAPEKEWLGKADAARLLGVATRQVERRTRQGYIDSRREPRGVNETTARVVYSRTDILALKAGKPNVHARPIPETEPAANDASRPISTRLKTDQDGSTALAVRPDTDPFAGLAAKLAGLAAFAAQFPPPPVTMPGPFVSLAEAVTLSGMPASWLVAQARAGVPWAVNVGTGKREFWRFSIAVRAGK